ncbi:MAG TPA: hypothetical protein VLJ11_13945 [Bryobacteraceae bacterium]|nr:hypothetical protein [Bryobacteraceae bacterium]
MNQKTVAALLFLLVSVIPGYSQVFSVGVKAGVPLNDSPNPFGVALTVSRSAGWSVPRQKFTFPFDYRSK